MTKVKFTKDELDFLLNQFTPDKVELLIENGGFGNGNHCYILHYVTMKELFTDKTILEKMTFEQWTDRARKEIGFWESRYIPAEFWEFFYNHYVEDGKNLDPYRKYHVLIYYGTVYIREIIVIDDLFPGAHKKLITASYNMYSGKKSDAETFFQNYWPSHVKYLKEVAEANRKHDINDKRNSIILKYQKDVDDIEPELKWYQRLFRILTRIK